MLCEKFSGWGGYIYGGNIRGGTARRGGAGSVRWVCLSVLPSVCLSVYLSVFVFFVPLRCVFLSCLEF